MIIVDKQVVVKDVQKLKEISVFLETLLARGVNDDDDSVELTYKFHTVSSALAFKVLELCGNSLTDYNDEFDNIQKLPIDFLKYKEEKYKIIAFLYCALTFYSKKTLYREYMSKFNDFNDVSRVKVLLDDVVNEVAFLKEYQTN